MREDAAKLYLDPKLNNYIVDLVQASRRPEAYDESLKRWCRFGASPRATIALARCARARAWLDGDEFVAPHHIQAVAPDVLRHRILLTFEGEAEGVTSDAFHQASAGGRGNTVMAGRSCRARAPFQTTAATR